MAIPLLKDFQTALVDSKEMYPLAQESNRSIGRSTMQRYEPG